MLYAARTQKWCYMNSSHILFKHNSSNYRLIFLMLSCLKCMYRQSFTTWLELGKNLNSTWGGFVRFLPTYFLINNGFNQVGGNLQQGQQQPYRKGLFLAFPHFFISCCCRFFLWHRWGEASLIEPWIAIKKT